MSWRMMKQFGAVALLSSVALALLAAARPVAGHEGGDSRKLIGTWNITLRFPTCSSQCPCPGGVPNIPIHALHIYGRDESFVEVGAGSLFRGPGMGLWESVDRHEFTAHFKFFLFKPDGSPRGSEEVTNNIELTGPDTFDSSATFDLFDAAGIMTGQGCPITESGTRFE